MKLGTGVAIAVVLWLTSSPCSVRAAQTQDSQVATQVYDRAKAAYDSTRYEEAASTLDEWVSRFLAADLPDERRDLAIRVLELRARARFNIGRTDEARSDFRQILSIYNHAYVLPLAVAQPTLRSLFDEVHRNTVGTVNLTVTPSDAAVSIKGKPVPAGTSILTLPGETYELVASRPGFRTEKRTLAVVPGSPQALLVALERVWSTLTFTTSPAGAEVLIGGESKGRTVPDPAAGRSVSRPFVIADVPSGRHTIDFRLDCYQPHTMAFDVTRPDDWAPVAVQLNEAMATIRVTSANGAGATVIRNGVAQGKLSDQPSVPFALDRLCQGEHTIEVQSAYGRSVRRYPDLRAGQVETFSAVLKPAFAIVSDSGLGTAVRGGLDYVRATESEFSAANTLLLFAPDPARVTEFSTKNTLPPDWLKFDAAGDQRGATPFGATGLRDAVTRMSEFLSVQGVAAVTQRDPARDPSDMLLILMAKGSATPDVIPWRLGDTVRSREVTAQFDTPPLLIRSVIGLTLVDVLDVKGAVVVAVEAGGRADAAGLRVGDVVTGAAGTPVAGAAQLLRLVESHAIGPLPLDVQSSGIAARRVDATVARVPSLVSLDDQSLWSNRLAAAYAALAAERSDVLERIAARMNLGAVLIRLGNYPAATTELDAASGLLGQIQLDASVSDSIGGTIKYLAGISAEAQRDYARAEAAWRGAAQAKGNLLSEGGEPLKELATRRLEKLAAGR